jgi:hypothetical protein
VTNSAQSLLCDLLAKKGYDLKFLAVGPINCLCEPVELLLSGITLTLSA